MKLLARLRLGLEPKCVLYDRFVPGHIVLEEHMENRISELCWKIR